jgi:trehalose/maltose hydrolase-like predicted phosphorylase
VLSKWDEITQKLNIPINTDGVLEQFSGYFELEELDWDHYKKTYHDIHRMDRILKSEGKSPNQYKVAKQADTLMTFYNLSEREIRSTLTLLGFDPPPDLLERNLHYYLQRTSHGSTLSRLVHAYLAHQVKNYELSWKLYQEALRSDYLDIQGGTTKEGIHLGVMTGTILFAYRTYAGLDWFGETLAISPRLPTGWQEMSFQINYRGGTYHFLITPEIVKVKLDQNQQGSIKIYNQSHKLKPGKWVETSIQR